MGVGAVVGVHTHRHVVGGVDDTRAKHRRAEQRQHQGPRQQVGRQRHPQPNGGQAHPGDAGVGCRSQVGPRSEAALRKFGAAGQLRAQPLHERQQNAGQAHGHRRFDGGQPAAQVRVGVHVRKQFVHDAGVAGGGARAAVGGQHDAAAARTPFL